MSDPLDPMPTLRRAFTRLGPDAGGWRVACCGSGGQSTSYRAETDGREVCIKVAAPGSIHLHREAVMLQRLVSPHVPHLLLDGSGDGFLVEEYIPGATLSHADPVLLLRQLPAIISGLAAATVSFVSVSPAIVHRDLKPANLRLDGERLVVLDFGSSEFEGSRASETTPAAATKLGGNKHHAQPLEQLLRSPSQDRRVDVFAAACVVFWVLTRKPPYQNVHADPGTARREYLLAQGRLYKTLRALPDEVRDCLVKALQVEPHQRAESLRPLAQAAETHATAISCCKLH